MGGDCFDDLLNPVHDQWEIHLILNFFQPETDMFSLVKTDTKYELAEGDQHPNHLAYKVWSDGFCKWLEGKKK